MKPVFIKLPSDLLESCETAAERGGYTISAYLRKIISDAHAPR